MPAAAASYFLALAPLIYLASVMPVELPRWAQALAGAAATSAAFVYGGAMTAPRFRLVTALALTVLHAVAFTLAFVVIVEAKSQSVPLGLLGLCLVVSLAATVWVCVQMKDKD